MARTYGMSRLKEGLESGIVALGTGAVRNVVGVRSAARIAAGSNATAAAIEAQEKALLRQPVPNGLLLLDGVAFGLGVLAEIAGAFFGMPALGELGEGAWIPATAYGGEDLTQLIRRKTVGQASGSSSGGGTTSSNVRTLQVQSRAQQAQASGAAAGYGGYDADFDRD